MVISREQLSAADDHLLVVDWNGTVLLDLEFEIVHLGSCIYV